MSRYYIQPIDPAELAQRFSTEDILDPIHGQDEEWMNPRLDKIRDVLDRLPDRETDLIRLYFFRNKKQTDIAEIFGITQAAVSYRIKRALSRIRFLVDMPDLDKHDIYDILIDIMPTELDASIFKEMYETTCQSEVANRLEITQGRVRHRFIKNLHHLGKTLLDRFYAWANTLDPTSFEAKNVLEKLDCISHRMDGMEPEDFEEELNAITAIVEDLPSELQDEETLQFAAIYRVFVRIRYNFNILREVKLPKWSKRAKNTLT